MYIKFIPAHVTGGKARGGEGDGVSQGAGKHGNICRCDQFPDFAFCLAINV